MMKVIEEKISDGCLWRRSFERRVRVWQGGSCVESRVRNSEHSHLTIVALNVFDHPVDGIPCVRAFINCRLILHIVSRYVRPHVIKSTFAHEAATYVLESKDVHILHEES